jgi:hypothetical protein
MTDTSILEKEVGEVIDKNRFAFRITNNDFSIKNLTNKLSYLVWKERGFPYRNESKGEKRIDWRTAEDLIEKYIKARGKISYNEDIQTAAKDIIKFWKSPEYVETLRKNSETRFYFKL